MRSPLAVQQRQSPTRDVAGRVQFRVIPVAAGHALETRLGAARGRVRMATRGAGPAGVGRVHRNQPRRLVRERRPETAPAGRQDPAVQAGLLPDMPAGRRRRGLRRRGHRARPPCLDHHRALGQRPAHLVLPVAVPLRDPPLRARRPSPGALAPSRAAALPGEAALIPPLPGLKPLLRPVWTNDEISED